MTAATEHNLAVARALGYTTRLRSPGPPQWEVKDSDGKHVGEIADRAIAGIEYWFCPWDDIAQALEAAEKIFQRGFELRYAGDGYMFEEAVIVGAWEYSDNPSHAICRVIELAAVAQAK